MHERDMGKAKRGREREREIRKRLKKQKKTTTRGVTQRLSINHSHRPTEQVYRPHVITDSSNSSGFARAPGKL